MSSKLDILREYNEDIQLINANEFKNINASLIPDLWVEVFSEHNREKRIKKILSIWKKYVDNNLFNTIAYLSEYLEDIELMISEDTYSILYTIKIKVEKIYIMKEEILKIVLIMRNQNLHGEKFLNLLGTFMKMFIMDFMITQVNRWD